MKRVWKKQKGIVAAGGALIFALASIGLFGVAQKPARAQFNPEQYGNVYGFIHSDTFGDISMNCNNDFDGDGVVEAGESACGGNEDYGVFIDPSTLSIYGIGWSDALGLVCFGASCGPDTPPGPALGEGTTAQVSITIDASGIGIVSGWARVRSLAQGSEGWISLKGVNPDGAAFGVTIDFTGGAVGQWLGNGWNRYTDGTGLGWLDVSRVYTTFLPSLACTTEGATRACGTDVGVCQPGSQTCTNGFWGACTGGVGPQGENCGDALDNDCDGSIDEGCGGCDMGQTMSCGAGACAGTQTCQAGSFWGQCESAGSPDSELCNGIDDNCNGLVDERPDCLFTVTPPQGVYEPLCCSSGAPSGGQCPVGTQAVFCDGTNIGKKLTGTHLHTFDINLSTDVAVSGNASCKILAQKPGRCSLTAHTDCTVNADCPGSETCVIEGPATREIVLSQPISGQQATLSYTVNESDPVGEIPWVITECAMGSLNQSVGAAVFVHGNTWNELDQLNYDLYSALDCWYDVRHRYFNNAARCNLEGDYAFVRSMSRGVPVEGNCTDGLDNDGNGLADCADRWCKGIAYQCQ